VTGCQILVMAKEPVPGQVKTRLCPPATPEQAAAIAAAALADTLDTVAAVPAYRHVLVLAGRPSMHRPPVLATVPQRGTGLADRLANAYADTALPGTAALLVGMDTPQVTTDLLAAAIARLSTTDAVLGMAADGGWWALGLREPRHAAVLRDVPMSTPDTGRLTRDALRANGLRVADLPVLRDVDTADDAVAVAAEAASGRFAAAVRRELGERRVTR
jgi:uncharacterized protein